MCVASDNSLNECMRAKKKKISKKKFYNNKSRRKSNCVFCAAWTAEGVGWNGVGLRRDEGHWVTTYLTKANHIHIYSNWKLKERNPIPFISLLKSADICPRTGMHLLCSSARMIEANPKHPSTPLSISLQSIPIHLSSRPIPLFIYPILPNPN